jgi:hypothetical protein
MNSGGNGCGGAGGGRDCSLRSIHGRLTIHETMDQGFGHAARRDHLDPAIVVDAHGESAGTSAASQQVAR